MAVSTLRFQASISKEKGCRGLALMTRSNPAVFNKETASIQCPPPTILCLILELALATQNHDERPVPMVASHVCHAWREAVLAEPTLWSRITLPTQGRAQTVEMLNRAGESSLDVDIDVDNHAPNASVHTVLAQLPRVRRLRMFLAAENCFAACTPHLLRAAPRLEALTLLLPDCDEHYANLPDGFLGGVGGAPRLRELTLHRFVVRWDAPLLRGLLRLDLNFAQAGTSATIKDILEMLAASPRLEELRYRSLPCQTPRVDSGSSFPAVALPKLQMLSLEMNHYECAGLVKHLRMPAAFEVALVTEGYNDSEPMPIAAGLPMMGEDAALSCQLHNDSVRVEVGSAGFAHTTIEVHWENSACAVDVARDLIHTTPLAGALEFTLNIDAADIGPSPCRTILSVLPHVRALNLSSTSGLPLCTLQDFTGEPLCPELTRLGLRNLMFEDGEDGEESDSDACAFDALIACIAERARRGFCMDYVCISSCEGFYPRHAEALKGIVREVIWDHISEDPVH